MRSRACGLPEQARGARRAAGKALDIDVELADVDVAEVGSWVARVGFLCEFGDPVCRLVANRWCLSPAMSTKA
jgi:hypothetical protein